MKTNLTILLSFILLSFGTAQTTRINKTKKHNRATLIHYEKQVSLNQYFDSEYQVLGLASPDDMQLNYTSIDKSGVKHTKYKQMYQNIPVVGGTYILHSKKGKVQASNGNLYPNIEIDVFPKISSSKAKNKVYNFVLARLEHQYKDFDPLKFNAKFENEGLCIIDKSYPDFSGNYSLAYKVKMKAFLNGYLKESIYVDAKNGQILASFSDIHQVDVIGEGETIYYGKKSFVTDSISPNQFLLQDKSKGVYILDASQAPSTENEYGFPVFENSSKEWNLEGNDAAALDAHYCATSYYDMLKERFNRNSIDDHGAPLVCGVHIPGFFGDFLLNAYWDGETTNFGDGDCDNYGPLTTLSIVGHEFTHGMTDYTSRLVYQNESGAINESMSDIFGKALEYYELPEDFTWILDKLFIKSADGVPFRNMKNPNLTEHPKYYKGKYWDFDQEVHTNSNVFNYWFYLLVNGEKGTNEKVYHYDVKPIGMDKAIDIVYGVQTGYLTETSNYNILYAATIAETKELYGDDSPELASVIEAWKTVGIDGEVHESNLKLTVLDLPNLNFWIPLPICDLSEPYIFKYQIENTGIPVEKDTELTVNFMTDKGDVINTRKIILDKDLKTNDVVAFQDSVMLTKDLFGFGGTTITVELDRNDDLLEDNFVEVYVSNPSKDVHLSISTYNNDYSRLCDEAYLIQLDITNRSCTEIPNGTEYTLLIENDKEKITSKITLDQTLGYEERTTITLDQLPKDFGPIRMTLKQEGNSIEFLSYVDYAGPGAFEGFPDGETVEFNDEEYSKFIEITGETNVVKLNDDKALGFIGMQPYFPVTDCSDINDFFISQQRSNMSFCVDASEMQEPKIRFDLTFIENKIRPQDYDIPQEQYTMVRMSIDDKTFPLIYNQKHKETVSHIYELPIGYVGKVEFEVFALGVYNSINSTAFDKNNWVLFDNLRVYDRDDVATQDINIEKFDVHPNPVSNIISINTENENTEYDIKFYDILGQQIGQDHFKTSLQYDVSNFSNGTVIYQISDKGKLVNVGKIAVLK